jgi:hypothetical protein
MREPNSSQKPREKRMAIEENPSNEKAPKVTDRRAVSHPVPVRPAQGASTRPSAPLTSCPAFIKSLAPIGRPEDGKHRALSEGGVGADTEEGDLPPTGPQESQTPETVSAEPSGTSRSRRQRRRQKQRAKRAIIPEVAPAEADHRTPPNEKNEVGNRPGAKRADQGPGGRTGNS